MFSEQIVRMDCDRCELQTEHYVLDYGNRPTLVRCMRCGHVSTNIGDTKNREHYPMDDRKPVYVV